MIKSIKIFSVSLILLMSMNSPPVEAKATFYGNVRNQYENDLYFNFYKTDKARTTFPLNHYEYRLFAYDLKSDKNTLIEYAIKDPQNYKAVINGDLDLISSDQYLGTYKFKLTLKPAMLDYLGNTNTKRMMLGGVHFDANIVLQDGSSAVFYIEVTLKYNKKGKPILINSKNNKYFDLVFFVNKAPILKRIHDFPVKMTNLND